jgi:hypothetical protein
VSGLFSICAEEDSNLHPVIPDQALNLAYESVAASMAQNRANRIAVRRQMRRMTRAWQFSSALSIGALGGRLACIPFRDAALVPLSSGEPTKGGRDACPTVSHMISPEVDAGSGSGVQGAGANRDHPTGDTREPERFGQGLRMAI